jgi:hypothetical protein
MPERNALKTYFARMIAGFETASRASRSAHRSRRSIDKGALCTGGSA